MTKKKRYKRYSPEFKREALMRASEEGVTDVIVCEELDISARQLRRWRSIYDLAERGLLEKEARQRVVRDDACKDPELAAILAHNRDEEKEHVAMELERVSRKDTTFDKEPKNFLFTDKEIAHT